MHTVSKVTTMYPHLIMHIQLLGNKAASHIFHQYKISHTLQNTAYLPVTVIQDLKSDSF